MRCRWGISPGVSQHRKCLIGVHKLRVGQRYQLVPSDEWTLAQNAHNRYGAGYTKSCVVSRYQGCHVRGVLQNRKKIRVKVGLAYAKAVAAGGIAMAEAYEVVKHSYDVVIIGAGGAGLRAALGMASSGLKTLASRRFSRHAAIPWMPKAAWRLRWGI
jgi:hypothetical protein